ncbi:MAG: Gx transporter family protein [Lachnospiraceae bacterium]|nr:Gx transporter family protein [Lachnospiraceae bacterium]
MRTDRLAKMGLLLALGMILSYVEALFPIAPSMPGVKIGLANMLVVLLLYSYGWKYGTIYQLSRILLTAMLFGNLFSCIYSLAGAALSMAVMIGFKKSDFLDMAGISMAGGIAHNIGQLIIAYFVVQNTAIGWYMPILLITGAVSGYVIGFISEILLKRKLL